MPTTQPLERIIVELTPSIWEIVCAVITAAATVALAIITWRYVLVARDAVKASKDESQRATERTMIQLRQDVDIRNRQAQLRKRNAIQMIVAELEANENALEAGDPCPLLDIAYANSIWAIPEATTQAITKEMIAGAYVSIKKSNAVFVSAAAPIDDRKRAWEKAREDVRAALIEIKRDEEMQGLLQ